MHTSPACEGGGEGMKGDLFVLCGKISTVTLATLIVCCSMASWILPLSCSWILLNSSADPTSERERKLELERRGKEKDAERQNEEILREEEMEVGRVSPIQQSPPSARTRAPASSCHSPPSCSLSLMTLTHSLSLPTLTAATVSPALVLPRPVVSTDRGTNFTAYFRI